ncbi:MAG: hypothetical protein K8F91_22730 [Candidatus Obscuribacterales bacterium]|nr:hypothetical protein [Candidatus Obscuribacterales bacterium]
MKTRIVTLFTVLLCVSLTQSCSTSQRKEIDTETQTKTAREKNQPEADFIKLDDYRFRLAPDVQKDGIAHLDFYVHDKDSAHVKGVSGTFYITKPDGTKIEIPIEEEKPHDHYHGMINVDQPGEYMIVAQVSIDGQKYNPRFSFSRKEELK